MPTKSYQYYVVEQFPRMKLNESVESISQLPLSEDIDRMPRTVITYSGKSENPEFEKYAVMHEDALKIVGRYQNKPIRQVIRQTNFNMFLHRKEKIAFLDAKRGISTEAIRRLSRKPFELTVTEQQINLVRLASELQGQVRGGWFIDLQYADVKAIAIYGSTVGESDEWDTYQRVGKLKNVDLQLILDGAEYRIRLGARRYIILFEPFPENILLELLLEIQHRLDRYLITV